MTTTRFLTLSLSLGFLFTVAVASSCSSTPDDGGGTTTDAGGKTDGGKTDGGADAGKADAGHQPMNCGNLEWSPDTTCQSCVESNCCDELAACDTGSACADAFDCVGKCGPNDQACAQACAQNNQSGFSDAQAMAQCADSSCKTECTSAQICDSGLSTPNKPACGQCLNDNCCAAFKDCAADQACLDCITKTPTAACNTNTLAKAANNCAGMNCSADCQ